VVPEAPARGESQSNGAIEEAGKTIREYVRVLKDQVETNAKIKLSESDNVVQWMVRWSAMMWSRYAVGRDGRTAYERRRGRRCKIPVVPFAERVWYKQVREGKDRKNKFDSEWRLGLWLGHARCSNEIIIGTKEGVVRAYSIKRREEGARWSAEDIKNLKGTPQKPDPCRPGSFIPIRINMGEDEEEAVKTSVPSDDIGITLRRMKITKGISEKYGYTED